MRLKKEMKTKVKAKAIKMREKRHKTKAMWAEKKLKKTKEEKNLRQARICLMKCDYPSTDNESKL